ncbi:Outer envelope pore protein 37, chloroplastic [Asimina triloba]
MAVVEALDEEMDCIKEDHGAEFSSTKLYWYNFNSNDWSTVYKHTMGKNLKFKGGYDSEVRLGWASLWVGEEDGKAKTAPLKMKVQFMLQVPQDDIASSVFMFRVKKSQVTTVV